MSANERSRQKKISFRSKGRNGIVLTILSVLVLTVLVGAVGAHFSEVKGDTNQNESTDPFIEWANNFGGSDVDHYNNVAATSDGGFVAVGYASQSSFGTGDLTNVAGKGGSKSTDDAIIVKYISDGAGGYKVQWAKSFGGTDDDYFYDVIATTDGGFVAVGAAWVVSSGDWGAQGITAKGGQDAIIVKFNSDGIVEWAKNFGGNSADVYYGVTETSSGSIVAVGYSASGSFGNGDLSGVTGRGSYDGIIVEYSLSGNVTWKGPFGGSDEDRLCDVTSTTDGGFVAVGYSYGKSFGNGDLSGLTSKSSSVYYEDAVIVKYVANGSGYSVGWVKSFGGTDEDEFFGVAEVSDGSIVAVGYSWIGGGDFTTYNVTGKGGYDAIIVKFNSGGVLQWAKSFGGTGADYYNAVAATSDGGFIAVGNSVQDSFGTGDLTGLTGKGGYSYSTDSTITMYNGNGELQWKNSFGGSGDDEYLGVAVTSDGGFVAAGWSDKFDGDLAAFTARGSDDGILVKYGQGNNSDDPSVPQEPVLSQISNFGGTNADYYRGVAATSDGGYVAVGYSTGTSGGDWTTTNITNHGNDEAIIVKYDKNNNVEWAYSFGGTYQDYFYAVTETTDGCYVAVGQSYGYSFGNGDWAGIDSKNPGSNNRDATAVKFDSNGNVLWEKNFGGTGSEYYYGVAALANGGFVAVGYGDNGSYGTGDFSNMKSNGSTEAFAVVYGGDGSVLWAGNFGGSGTDYYQAVAATSDGGFVAAGYSASSSFNNGSWAGVTAKSTTSSGEDMILVKYISDGAGGYTIDWKQHFGGGTNRNEFNGVTATSDGGFVAVGLSAAASFGSGDWTGVTSKGTGYNAVAVKFGANGNILWANNFGGSTENAFNEVAAMPGGGAVAVGYAYQTSFGTGDWVGITGKGGGSYGGDASVVVYDKDGNIDWKNNFGGSDTDVFWSVTAVSDGFVAAGYSYPASFGTGDLSGTAGKGGNDATIARYSTGGPLQQIAVTGISIDQTALSLTVGDTATITATISPSDATNKDITWSSDNTDVATVGQNGVVHAVGAGSATITVATNDGGKTATCTVNVSSAPKGDTYWFYIDLGGYSAIAPTWYSAEGSKAVEALKTALDTAGISYSILSSEWISDIDGVEGDYLGFPANAPWVMYGIDFAIWYYADYTGDYSGEWTMVSSTMSTSPSNIFLIWFGYYDWNTLTDEMTIGYDPVNDNGWMGFGPFQPIAVNGVDLSQSTLSMTVGGTGTLTATVTPSNATDASVTWTSSNDSVATVDQAGNVTAVGAGSATITVTTTDGNFEASCAVTVKAAAPLASISAAGLSKTTYTAGEALSLSGLTVTATYIDGSSALVTGYIVTLADGSLLRNVGTQTIYVIYTENGISQMTSFTVTVTAAAPAPVLTGLSATGVTKTTYNVGDKLDLSGLTVTGIYGGTSSVPVSGYTVTMADGSFLRNVGTQTIYVIYTDGGVTQMTSFTVTVTAIG